MKGTIAPDSIFSGTELKVGMKVEYVNGKQFLTPGHIGEFLRTVTGEVTIEASMPSKSKSSESSALKRMRKSTADPDPSMVVAQAPIEAARLWSKDGNQNDSFRTAVYNCLTFGYSQSMIARQIRQAAYAEPFVAVNDEHYRRIRTAVKYANKVWKKSQEPKELDDSPSCAVAMASQIMKGMHDREKNTVSWATDQKQSSPATAHVPVCQAREAASSDVNKGNSKPNAKKIAFTRPKSGFSVRHEDLWAYQNGRISFDQAFIPNK